MLTMQNSDGGFASYELVRGSRLLKYINPGEVFGKTHRFHNYTLADPVSGDVMTESSYPECTTSVITALAHFRRVFPDYRRQMIE